MGVEKVGLEKVLKSRARERVLAGEDLATPAEPEVDSKIDDDTQVDAVDAQPKPEDFESTPDVVEDNQEQTDLGHEESLDTEIKEEDGPAAKAIKNALAAHKAKEPPHALQEQLTSRRRLGGRETTPCILNSVLKCWKTQIETIARNPRVRNEASRRWPDTLQRTKKFRAQPPWTKIKPGGSRWIKT